MQVPNIILMVTAELYAALLIGAIILLFHIKKLKLLITRQQEKLLELLRELQNKPGPIKPAPIQPIAPVKTYKSYLSDVIATTSAQYKLVSPESSISAAQEKSSPLFQRILALRYSFLRSEELAATEIIDSTEYWNTVQQTLAPLLAPEENKDKELENELKESKTRIKELEKVKRRFFDMEKQWSNAQTNAQNHYSQLLEMFDDTTNKKDLTDALQQYQGAYSDISKTILDAAAYPDAVNIQKTVLITRPDPHTVAEIVKLRNVAADQHRIINQLQRQLAAAKTAEEKNVVIGELEKQLSRQTRFVQESETCIQLLEDELARANEELKLLDQYSSMNEDYRHIKNTLQNVTLENKELARNLANLEIENILLKQNNQHTTQGSASTVLAATEVPELKKIHAEYTDLKNQYAELEEKYLDLKLGNYIEQNR